jgi:hypothetical protein
MRIIVSKWGNRMNWDRVKRIADAVLYEGYILYPYRASAVKNQQRFNFGVLIPGSDGDAPSSGETCAMRTECLVEGEAPSIDVCVRFLQLSSREVGLVRAVESAQGIDDIYAFEPVSSLEIDGRLHHAWQEAVEREVVIEEVDACDPSSRSRLRSFSFGPGHECESLGPDGGGARAVLVRRQQQIQGVVAVEAEAISPGVWRVGVEIRNTTPRFAAQARTRDELLMFALASTHTILGVNGGRFVSLLEPGEALATPAARCRNVGTWPVLVGEPASRDVMLSSPIILYDYPEVAPESAFDFFDGTEIDEMLALRVLTLTDEEKRLMASVDNRAKEILARTESLPQEQWMKLHGAIRGLKPVTASWSQTSQ